jgi:phosphate transport system substrate-binding protein
MVRAKVGVATGFFMLLVLLAGCNPEGNEAQPQEVGGGVMHLSADESFRPVIDAQIQVFESSFPDSKIVAHYKPEAECLKDFLVDSISLILTTRGFTEKEEQYIVDSFRIDPSQMTVAVDAIAVIVNTAAADSFFTMDEIRDLVSGKSNSNFIPVFDGVRATSTVRFMIDSVLQGGPLGENVTAARSSTEVIDYVSKNTNAVGFIGVSWIGNKEDSAQLAYLKKVRIANIQSRDNPDAYIKPLQVNIYALRYPMVRDLVYVLKERNKGIGHRFANFLSGDRGQRIFRRAYLLPAKQPLTVRPTSLKQ